MAILTTILNKLTTNNIFRSMFNCFSFYLDTALIMKYIIVKYMNAPIKPLIIADLIHIKTTKSYSDIINLENKKFP